MKACSGEGHCCDNACVARRIVFRLVSVVMFLFVSCCCLFSDSQIRSYVVCCLVCSGFLDDCIFCDC